MCKHVQICLVIDWYPEQGVHLSTRKVQYKNKYTNEEIISQDLFLFVKVKLLTSPQLRSPLPLASTYVNITIALDNHRITVL